MDLDNIYVLSCHLLPLKDVELWPTTVTPFLSSYDQPLFSLRRSVLIICTYNVQAVDRLHLQSFITLNSVRP